MKTIALLLLCFHTITSQIVLNTTVSNSTNATSFNGTTTETVDTPEISGVSFYQMKVGAGAFCFLNLLFIFAYVYVLVHIYKSGLHKQNTFFQQIFCMGVLDVTELSICVFNFILTMFLGVFTFPIIGARVFGVVEDFVRQSVAALWVVVALNRLVAIAAPTKVSSLFSIKRSKYLIFGCFAWSTLVLIICWNSVSIYYQHFFFRKHIAPPIKGIIGALTIIFSLLALRGTAVFAVGLYIACIVLLVRRKRKLKSGGSQEEQRNKYRAEKNLLRICIILFSLIVFQFLFETFSLKSKVATHSITRLLIWWLFESLIYGINPLVYVISSTQIRNTMPIFAKLQNKVKPTASSTGNASRPGAKTDTRRTWKSTKTKVTAMTKNEETKN